ncbi:glutamate--tRNA ligase [Pseudonocardia acaciae]|uniref:glutamate--tRNA ligase n=1 Tax=Pseudonocardia acaciae TaxID=551276 RepID=UPI00048AB855|nr:glutamate--tRNA ligase family protein [Pseudonocardia acaciae]
MLDRALIDGLFPADLPDPSHWEQRYPPRDLPEGAKVTRFAPSPTGFVHIGGVYVAMIAKDVAHRSGGAYLVRVEDTDQAREVAGVAEQFARVFAYFDIAPDEGDPDGGYGPYRQSERERIYLSYARELMRRGEAYPCFCTREELAAITEQQQAAKLPTGYYGSWARWRDADPDEVAARLRVGEPYVVRFRSPGVEGRASYTDAIRGRVEHEANRNDVVILKTSANSPRLPTYHFAHAVDDHLMRVNLVIRGDEWLSSVPLHLQLFAALGFEQPTYAHIAPLMKLDGSARRKLSKRRDPEASVDFYVDSGYPAEAVLYYLRGLANGRLAELPLADALSSPIRLEDCGVAGPLVDLVKLADISGDHIATLPGPVILDSVVEWARSRDPELVSVLDDERTLAERAVDVERVGVENPRKDLTRWSDFRALYGFFFPSLFTLVTDPGDERFGGLDVTLVRKLAADFADTYAWNDDQPTWFGQIRELAARHGFAPNPKTYKKDPDAYPGMLRDAANVIRVALTGSSRSPDLHAVAGALGVDEVTRRVRALAG